jgi:type I restriction enzyme S subunit
MPEWTSSKLESLASFQKGRKVTTSVEPLSGFTDYLGAGALVGGHDGYADSRFGVIAREQDVLMLWDGENSGLVSSGLNGVVSSTVARLSPRNISTKFLHYALAAKFEWIQNQRTGSGVPHVPKDLRRKLTIAYPVDPREQDSVSEILVTVDAAIRETEALIGKMQCVKAGMVHDLFTRGVTSEGCLRPPRAEAPHLYKKSTLGWIPKEWAPSTLESVRDPSRPITYGVLKPGEFVQGGVPLLQIEDVIHGDISWDRVHRIGRALDAQYSRTRVSGEEIVISLVGTIGRVAHLPRLPESANLHRNLALLAVKDDERRRYIFHYLQSSAVTIQWKGTTVGSTQSLLNLNALRSTDVPLPPDDECARIVDPLDTVDRELIDAASSVAKFNALKSGLMRDLLNGRVRVNVDN